MKGLEVLLGIEGKVSSVAILLYHPETQKFLFVRSKKSYLWSLPGGGVLQNEIPYNACLRELLEETNNKYHSSMIEYWFQFRIRGTSTVMYMFTTNYKYNIEGDNNEINKWKWVSFEQAIKMKTRKFFKTDILHIKNGINRYEKFGKKKSMENLLTTIINTIQVS